MEFIETIRLENGIFHHLDLHQQRMERTIYEVFGRSTPIPDLKSALDNMTPIPDVGLYKCRLIYSREIKKVELEVYVPRKVNSLKIVEGGSAIDYHLKNADRSILVELASAKEDSDEVIILRDGLITDTSYTNLLFRSNKGKLYTPSKPLLRGVMLQSLLNMSEAIEQDLTLADIKPGNPLGLTEAIMINAMMPLSVAPCIPIDHIHI